MNAGDRMRQAAAARVIALEPYRAAYTPELGGINMSDNTSPYGPSARVLRMLRSPPEEIVAPAACASYPDQYCSELRAAIAGVEGVGAESIVTGNGADELIDIIVRAFVEKGGSVSVPAPAYSMYSQIASLNGAVVQCTSLGRPPSIGRLPVTGSGVVFISNPNNPTGVLFPARQLESLVGSYDGVVVVDEAYAEYAGTSAAGLVQEHDNLIILRTFSKAYGLASFRVGYAISSPSAASILDRARLPYNVSGFSQKVALAAVLDQEHIRSVRSRISVERERVSSELGRLGVYVFDSAANFVLMDCGADAGRVFESLNGMNVFTRRIELPGYEGCIRVTVRTGPENDTFLSCMRKIMED